MTQPKIALYLGTTHSGKSWALGLTLAAIARPFVVILSMDRDPSIVRHIGTRRTMFCVVSRPPRFPTAQDLLDFKRQGFRYVYFEIDNVTSEEIGRFMDSLAGAVASVGDLTLAIDEAHRFCRAGVVSDEFEGFVRGSRRRGVDVLFATHGYKDLAYGVRKVLQQYVLFHTDDDNDLRALSDDLRLGRDLTDRVNQLPPYSHLFVNQLTGCVTGPIQCLEAVSRDGQII